MLASHSTISIAKTGGIDPYRDKSSKPFGPLLQRQPNKYWIPFFLLLTFGIFSYLVFSSMGFTNQVGFSTQITSATHDVDSVVNLPNIIERVRDNMLNIGEVVFGSREKKPVKRGYTNQWKRILVYTKLFGSVEWHHMPRMKLKSIMSKCKCKVNKCRVTYNKKYIKRSDAVIFHAADMPHADIIRTLRQKRDPGKQYWVYFTSESPENVPDVRPLNGFFNLTMTTKVESDIWLPYGRFVRLGDRDKRPIKKNYAAGKDPSAAWVVSHCGKLRDEYILKLQEEYPVFVGGSCGPMFKRQMLCKKGCDHEIKKNFKFYLAFENGFCRNYITEKYWYRAIDNEVIPVVMGGGPYNFGQYGAIPGSFINVKDFSSVYDLATYLHYLDKNDTAYNEFFNWKHKYKRLKPVWGNWPFPCTFLCEICDIIHNLDYPNKTYDLSKFLEIERNCQGRDSLVRGILAQSRNINEQF